MAYTARGLIDYARSVADLQNTKFITYQDENNLLNEAYRDIYSRYTESDGDYYCIETVIDILPSMADPNNIGRGNLVPLPTDFLKIRTLSYNFGGQWCPVQKFSMSNRDNNTSAPCYRLKNGNLWIIGGTSMYTQIKLNYYPIPDLITFPDSPVSLASSETVYTYPTIVGGDYIDKLDIFFYIENNAGTGYKNIKAENIKTGVTTIIYQSTNNITGLTYHAGYLYWLNTVTKILYRSPAGSTLALVPASVKTSVENFTVQNNKIYYSTTTQTLSCSLSGGSSVLVLNIATIGYMTVGADTAYIDGSGYININGVATVVIASQIATDGDYIFWRDGLELLRGEIVASDITNAEIINANAVLIGIVTDGYVPVIEPDQIIAQSLIPDTVFDYPTNEVNEIMAYTSAVAYTRKQDNDKKMALLTARLTELWERFWSVNKRDEYQSTRINNDYQNGIGNW